MDNVTSTLLIEKKGILFLQIRKGQFTIIYMLFKVTQGIEIYLSST